MYHKHRIAATRWPFVLRSLAVLCGFWCSHLFALSVTLNWDADAGPNIVGYRVYYGTESGVYTQAADVGNTTSASIANIEPGNTYYFVVTASNASGLASHPSSEVSFETGPLAVNDTVLLVSASSVVIDVLANDKSPGGTPQIAQITQPKYGSAAINGDNTITYTAGANFPGTDSFTYTLSDGNGGSSTATVTVSDKGTFNGLISNASPDMANMGRLRIQFTHTGEFTGKMTLGALTEPVSGLFTSAGAATNVRIDGEPAAALTLNLDPGTCQITGSMAAESGAPSTIAASLDAFSTGTVSPEAGSYTLLLPPNPGPAAAGNPPAGTGFCKMLVTADGLASVTGRLADGTVLNTAAAITADGSVALYVPLYGGGGFLSGVLKFESVTTSGSASDIDGTLEWQKQEVPGGRARFSAGFDTTINAIGSTYSASDAAGTIADLSPAAQGQAGVTLSGGDLLAPVTDDVTLVAPGLFREQSPVKQGVVIQINRATGLFTGRFLDPAGNTWRLLAGAVFQKQGIAAGLFLTGTSSGSVLLTGGTTN